MAIDFDFWHFLQLKTMCRPFHRIPFLNSFTLFYLSPPFQQKKKEFKRKKVDNQNLMFCPLVRLAPSKIMDNTRKTVNIIVLRSYTRLDEFAIKAAEGKKLFSHLQTYLWDKMSRWCARLVRKRCKGDFNLEISVYPVVPFVTSISLPSGT